MRIFDKDKRLHTSLNTIDYFEINEYNYYSNHNVRKFTYNNEEYSSLYKRLNVQLVVTNKCPYNCPFCIEKINPTNDKLEKFSSEYQAKNLKKLLITLKNAGLEPTVSITGGEPTIYLEHITNIAKMLKELEVPYNLNTSGFTNDPKILENFDRINLSVHSANPSLNSKIFQRERDEYWKDDTYKDATIQRVITNNDFDDLIKFLDSFDQKRFSIRFVSRAETEPSFDWKPLFDKINADSRFEFKQQKIGDYYFFEEYKYKGSKLIRFSFSDIKMLEHYKENFEKDKKYVRAAIVLADGSVKFDWISS